MTQAETSDAELAACPFCGKRLVRRDKYWEHGDDNLDCFAAVLVVYPDAIERWNRRAEAQPSALSEVVEEGVREAQVEAAARVLCTAEGGDPDWPYGHDARPPMWTDFIGTARAMLAAALSAPAATEGRVPVVKPRSLDLANVLQLAMSYGYDAAKADVEYRKAWVELDPSASPAFARIKDYLAAPEPPASPPSPAGEPDAVVSEPVAWRGIDSFGTAAVFNSKTLAEHYATDSGGPGRVVALHDIEAFVLWCQEKERAYRELELAAKSSPAKAAHGAAARAYGACVAALRAARGGSDAQ